MTTTRSSLSSLTTMLMLVVSLLHPAAAQICNLCGSNGVQGIRQPNQVPQGSGGQTCAALAASTAVRFRAGSTACNNQRRRWNQACCTAAGSAGSTTYNSQAARCNEYRNHPKFALAANSANPRCNVCRTGEYPGKTSMVINFLYIGAATCAKYYEMGQRGQIARHMCAPVQFFSESPCGCGTYNPMKSCSTTAAQAPSTTTTSSTQTTTAYTPSGSTNTGGYSQAKTPSNQGKTSIAKTTYGGSANRGSNRRLVHKYRHIKGQSAAAAAFVEEERTIEEQVPQEA